jgi:poly(3-hydroxybutyrate) depolymerase
MYFLPLPDKLITILTFQGDTMNRLKVSLLLFSAMAFQGFALPSDSCLAGSTLLSNGRTMYFRLYVPRNYSTQYRYPLVMCLHGIGERGSDNRAQVDREYMDHQWMLDSVKSKYKPFVLYPQCPNVSNDEWTNYFAGNLGYSAPAGVGAVNVVDSLCRVYPIDTTRLYVGGLSWGGMGTEGIMMTYPNKFAASFPCAGENRLMTVSVMTRTAFWLFHGASDGTVPPDSDRALVTNTINAGTPVVRFYSGLSTSYPFGITTVTGSVSFDSLGRAVAGGSKYLYHEINGGDHGSGWHAAFFSTLLVPWLMSKSKVNGQIVFTWPPPGPASTAVSSERQASSLVGGKLRVANGTVRWSGVSTLPSRLNVYSVKGALVARHDIRQQEGKLFCSALAKGVYLVEIDAGDRLERKTMAVH